MFTLISIFGWNLAHATPTLSLDDPHGCTDSATLEDALDREGASALLAGAWSLDVHLLPEDDAYTVAWTLRAPEGLLDSPTFEIAASECVSLPDAVALMVRAALDRPEIDWQRPISPRPAIPPWTSVRADAGLALHPGPGFALGLRATRGREIRSVLGVEGRWGSPVHLTEFSAYTHRLGLTGGLGLPLGATGHVLPLLESFVGAGWACVRDANGEDCYLIPRIEPSLSLRVLARGRVLGFGVSSAIPRIRYDETVLRPHVSAEAVEGAPLEPLVRVFLEFGIQSSGRSEGTAGRVQ